MKKLNIVFVLLIMGALLQGCQKTQDSTEISRMETLSLKIIQSNELTIASMKGLSKQDTKAAFISMTPDERKAVWLDHFSKYIEEKNLNSRQLELVKQVEFFILTNVLDENISEKAKEFEGMWRPNALKSFSESEVYTLVYTLDLDNDKNWEAIDIDGGGVEGPPKVYCNCNFGSVYACAFESQNCKGVKCIAYTGCGFAYLYKCNGKCYLK